MDVLGKLFVKMEAERKLAKKMLTDKIEDEKRTKGTTENETKLIDAFQTDKQADGSTEADVESSDTEIHAGMVGVPQTDEITEATLEAAAETERLAEEAESLQTEDEQTGIVVDAEDSDSAESLSQKTEDTQTGKLTDVLGKLFVKMEAEGKLAEKRLTDKIEDEKRTKGTTENETKLIDAFQTDKQADDSTEADVESSDTEIHAGMVEAPQTDEITEATLEAAAETERLAEEAESLQTEDEQTCIVVDAEDSVAAEIPTEKIDDTGTDDQAGEVIETGNQKDEIKSLEETENEKKQSVKVEPEKDLLLKLKVLKSAINNRTSDIKKPKSLKKIYLIGSGILTIIIAGAVFNLSGRIQKEDVIPVSMSTSFVHARNSIAGIQNVLNITRDAFASEQEFRKRLREAVSTFNNAVWQHNPDYQAATATLSREGSGIQSGKLPLSIKWQLWTKQLDREGYINVPSDKAKALLEEGEQKPVYIYLDIVEDALRISKIAMIGLEEEMTVSFWPGGTMKHDLISDMEFVWIPGRYFTMGSSSTDGDSQVSERVAHDVCMNGFWMGRYEVTQAQWERIMGQNNSESNNKQSGHGTSNNPFMIFSSEVGLFTSEVWFSALADCDEFLLRINGKAMNDMYRLPSEAEWEYAVRAGMVVRGGGVEEPPNFLRSASRSMLDYDNERQFHRIGFRLVRSGGFLD